ncbi:hypothetical protein AVXHC19_47580 [Acidovorax sacchari]
MGGAGDSTDVQARSGAVKEAGGLCAAVGAHAGECMALNGPWTGLSKVLLGRRAARLRQDPEMPEASRLRIDDMTDSAGGSGRAFAPGPGATPPRSLHWNTALRNAARRMCGPLAACLERKLPQTPDGIDLSAMFS